MKPHRSIFLALTAGVLLLGLLALASLVREETTGTKTAEAESPASPPRDEDSREELRAARHEAKRAGSPESPCQIERPESSPLDHTSDPEEALLFTVIDSQTGEPIGGASAASDPERPGAGCDERGIVAVPLRSGAEARFIFSAEGHITLEWKAPREALERGVPIRIPLVPAATIEGIARDESGRPMKDVDIWVWDAGGRSAKEELARWACPGSGRYRELDAPFDATKADGSFAVTGIVPCMKSQILNAYDSDSIAFRYEIPELDVGAAPHFVSVEMRRGATVQGAVRLGEEPIGRGQVQWQGPSCSGYCHIEDGRYRAEGVEPGRVEFRVQSTRLWTTPDPIVLYLTAGDEIERDIAIDVTLVPIRGRVTFSSGEPARNVFVLASPSSSRPRTRDFYRFGSGPTSEDGSYSVSVPPGDTYLVSARHGTPFATQRAGVKPGEEGVDLVIPKAGRLLLELVRANGKPLRFADRVDEGRHVSLWVYWRSPSSEIYQPVQFDPRGAPDDRGRLELELPLGVVDLALDGRAWDCSTVELHQIVVATEPTRALRVAFEDACSLRLTILADDLQNLRGQMRCLLIREDQRPHLIDLTQDRDGDDMATNQIHHQRIVFGSSGKARLRGLQPGRYSFVSIPEGWRFEPAAIDVAGDLEATVRIRPPE